MNPPYNLQSHRQNRNITQVTISPMSLKENSKEPRLKLPIIQALVPVFVLVALLFFNVIYAFGDDALSGSNQFLLLVGGAVAALVGVYNGISFSKMIDEVAENIKSTTGAILILLMVGALAGTWLLSGIIPTMIYYGLSLLKPSIFLLSTVVICDIISIATGSSWTYFKRPWNRCRNGGRSGNFWSLFWGQALPDERYDKFSASHGRNRFVYPY